MRILITYDISTMDDEGKKRLRKVAKACVNYGQRVQNSVFECQLDSMQLKKLELELISYIDEEKDSLRVYYLGNQKKEYVRHIGNKTSYDVNTAFIL